MQRKAGDRIRAEVMRLIEVKRAQAEKGSRKGKGTKIRRWDTDRAGRMASKQREGERKTACSWKYRLVHLTEAHGVRGGLQQTGPSARRGHTPPGFTGQAAPNWIRDRRWIGDIRRKEHMLVKVVTLEVTNFGVLEDKRTSE